MTKYKIEELKKKYPMFLCWSEYVNTHTRLPCKCQNCDKELKKTMYDIDNANGDCFCHSCAMKIKCSKPKRVVNKLKYPMVVDWSNYKTTTTKLKCECQGCGKYIYNSITEIDQKNGSCKCRSCATPRVQIEKEKYPSIVDWLEYTTIDKLQVLNKCPMCGKIEKKRFVKIYYSNQIYCKKCSTKNTKRTCLYKHGYISALVIPENRKKGIEKAKSKKSLEKKKITSQKNYGTDFPMQSEQMKQKIQEVLLIKYDKKYLSQIEWVKKKREDTMMKKYGVKHYMQCPILREKAWETKSRNGNMVYSKPEEECYQLLVQKYGKNDVVRQYKDSRYPFRCDFYIKTEDLFIEINFSPFHGKNRFNSSDSKDIERLKFIKNKKNDYYKSIIKNWTVRDVLKLKTAVENNLNYLTFYNMKEFNKWYIYNRIDLPLGKTN